jgi:heat shock protein HtpX
MEGFLMSGLLKEEGASKMEYEYTIDTELAIGNLKFLPEYLRRQYLLEHDKYRAFWDIHVLSGKDAPYLSYKVATSQKNQYVTVLIEPRVPIQVGMTLSDASVPQSFVDHLYEDLFLMVQMFEEEIRKSTLYFAFMPGEKIVPEKEATSWLIRFFTDSMIPLYVTLMALTFLFFWLFGNYAPLIYVALSFTLSLVSGKLIARSGSWKITSRQPEIHLLQYHLAPYQFEEFRESHAKKIPEIRKQIYEATIATQTPITCETAGTIFAHYGIACKPDDFSVKKVNLFEIVSKAAHIFDLAMPEVVVANNIRPNAAAAGPSSRLGTILITTGIITQLEDDELLSVIGHELSHLKNHDPLVMFFLSSAEYLLRFYVFWPYLFAFGLTSYWLYSMVSLGFIYFVGKFIEGRADLDSAKQIGQPKVMAEALRKIAFRRLFPLSKREPAFRGYRRIEWLQLAPHPPAYFRISRLNELSEPKKIKHTFLRSIKDSLNGFLRG